MTQSPPSDTDLEQQFTDRRLNEREPLQCNACGQQLHDDETVIVRLHQDRSDRSWLITGRFCTDCGPEIAQEPTPFAAEVVVRGRVGSSTDERTRVQFPTLHSPEIVDRKRP